MNESELERYLQGSKVNSKMIDAHIRDRENNIFPQRQVFESLAQTTDAYFNHKSELRMIALTGLRGVGKTTLMWQLAKKIFDQYSQNVYFFDIKALSKYFREVKLHIVFSKFEQTILKKISMN